MKKIVFAVLVFAWFNFQLHAQEKVDIYENPLSFEASYTGDNAFNMHRGIKSGYAYLGMANMRLGLDTEKAGLWNGGFAYLNVANTHGAIPSANLFGDMQVASNIEAGNHTYIQEIWLRQALGNMEFTFGLQDMNVEFANTQYGSLFLNSSFGILPVISNNIAVPIFPLTSLGITLKWKASEQISWINAFYDGCPTDFENNPYNITWQFNAGDGLLAISEVQYTTEMGGLSSSYKAGIYSHNHVPEKTLDLELPDSLKQNTLGMYAYADQSIWERGPRKLGIFTQLGYSPSAAAYNDFYLGLGMNLTGLFSKHGNDILGLAMAHEQFNSNLKSETVLELSYQYSISEYIFIQPDFQYIINPAGTGQTLNNCVAGFLRVGLSF